MRDPELKNKVILFYIENGAFFGKGGTARMFGLSRSTVQYWLRGVQCWFKPTKTDIDNEILALSIEREWL